MIDFHTHILPGMDDGSPNLDVTCGMLREEQEQQVSLVVATPHFYAQETGVDTFLRRRQEALSQVLALDGMGSALPQVVAGAEILYFPGIGRASRVRELSVTGTNTILLEMPFAQWNEQVLHEVCELLEEQQLQIVIAHVERYWPFQKRKKIWKHILDLPLTLQVNAGSWLKDRRRRRLADQLLSSGRKIIIGSDCHNLQTRPPGVLQEARSYIKAHHGAACLAAIDRQTEKVLRGYEKPEKK